MLNKFNSVSLSKKGSSWLSRYMLGLRVGNFSLGCYLPFVGLTVPNCSFPGLKLVTCLSVCTLLELLSMWNLTRIEVHLCNLLSPEAPQLSLASYNWGLVSKFLSLFYVLQIWTPFLYLNAILMYH